MSRWLVHVTAWEARPSQLVGNWCVVPRIVCDHQSGFAEIPSLREMRRQSGEGDRQSASHRLRIIRLDFLRAPRPCITMFPSFRAPETMTAAEQANLLRATAAHPAPRDHVLYSMALGTGLRLS